MPRKMVCKTIPIHFPIRHRDFRTGGVTSHNLILLLWIYGRASKALSNAGYTVGFLGVNLNQFLQNNMRQSTEE